MSKIIDLLTVETNRIQRKKRDIKALLENIKKEQPSTEDSKVLREYIAARMPEMIKYYSQLESICEHEQFIAKIKQEYNNEQRLETLEELTQESQKLGMYDE